jgi:hypothetical protein
LWNRRWFLENWPRTEGLGRERAIEQVLSTALLSGKRLAFFPEIATSTD